MNFFSRELAIANKTIDVYTDDGLQISKQERKGYNMLIKIKPKTVVARGSGCNNYGVHRIG